jgi:hypothetical protein
VERSGALGKHPKNRLALKARKKAAITFHP